MDGTNLTMSQQIQAKIPQLRRYARALTKSDGDDLIQNTLTRAIEKQHLYKRDTDLRAWLFTILHNTFVNTVRKGARDPMVYGEDQKHIVENYQANSDPSAGLLVRDIERCLDRLDPNQKAVILLVSLEGLSYDEAAEFLQIPVGTVRSRLSRGRDALKQLMAR